MKHFEMAEKNKKLAAIQYIRLLGQKNPENVVSEANGLFSHTNTKGKKRMLLPCITFDEYKVEKEKHNKTKMQKCLGYYVLEIVS